MLSPDANKHEWIHFVHWTAKIHIQVSVFDRESHPTLLGDHKAHLRLDHCHLWLHRLLDDGNLRLHRLLNDSNLRLHHWLDHRLRLDNSNVLIVEVRAHHEVTAIHASMDKLNALMNRAAGSKHSKGYVGVSDRLAPQQVLIADLDTHDLV